MRNAASNGRRCEFNFLPASGCCEGCQRFDPKATENRLCEMEKDGAEIRQYLLIAQSLAWCPANRLQALAVPLLTVSTGYPRQTSERHQGRSEHRYSFAFSVVRP